MASRTLKYVFAGDTRKLNRSTQQVDGRLGKLAQVATKYGKVAAVGIAAIGVAVVGVGVAVSKSLAKFDDIGKASARIGITTDAVQKLGFAAEQSGANFDTVERGLTRMAAALDDARLSENAPAARTLKSMNLSIEQFDGLNPEQQLELFADALSQVEDPSLRAAYAQDVFGRSGAQLLPLLQNGSAGMRALGKEFEATGGLIDGKAIKSGERFNDTMNVINKTIMAVRDQFVAALLPTLQRVADVFREKVVPILRDVVIPILVKLGEVSLTVFEAFLDSVEGAVSGAVKVINVFIDGINKVISGLNKVPGVSIDAIGKIDELSFSFGTAKTGAEDTSASVDGLTQAIDYEAQAAQDGASANDTYGASLSAVREDALAAGAAIEGLYTAQQQLNLAMQGFADVASAAALAAKQKIDYGSASGSRRSGGGSGSGSCRSSGGGGGSSGGSGSGGGSGDSGGNGGGSGTDGDEGFLEDHQLGYATHRETGERVIKERTSGGDIQYRVVSGGQPQRGGDLLEYEDEGEDMLEMAKGGIIRARPGGRIVRVAEGGQDEAIIPLGRGARGLGTTVNMNVRVEGGLISQGDFLDAFAERVNILFEQGVVARA